MKNGSEQGRSGRTSRDLRQGGRPSGREKKIMDFYKYAGTRSQGLLVLKDNHVRVARSQGGVLLVPNLIVPLGSSPFSCIDPGLVYVR
jgi:hypothetical protein